MLSACVKRFNYFCTDNHFSIVKPGNFYPSSKFDHVNNAVFCTTRGLDYISMCFKDDKR